MRRYRRRTPSGFSKRRRTGRPSGAGRKRLSRGMYKQPSGYTFRRNCFMGEIQSQTVPVVGGLVFALEHLPNYTEFTTLFDQYRINKVVCKFIPTANQLNVNTAPNTVTVPQIYTVTDYDSATSPSTVNEMMEYATVKAVSSNKPFTRVLVPRTASPIFRSGVTAAYMQNPARQWIDCNYHDVPHYGIRYYLMPSLANYSFVYRVEAVFYFTCKSLR